MFRSRAGGLLLLILMVLALSAPAVQAGTSVRLISLISDSGTFNPEGMIIDSVEVDNRDIYDTSNPAYSSFLFRMANRLHIVTKKRIIEREVLFSKGERFNREIAEETARNLRQHYPLNDSWIELERLGNNRLLVRVVTVDRWSLVGGLKSVNTDAGETDYQVGFEERNFLGRAQFWSFDYYVREAEDNYVTAEFRERRLFGSTYDIRWEFGTNPFDHYKRLSITRPFHNLAQQWGYGATLSDGGSKKERFLSNTQIAGWEDKLDMTDMFAAFRWGPYYRKTTITARYSYLLRQLTDRVILDSAAFTPEQFPDDSVYHEFDVGIEQSRQKFIVEHRLEGFSYNEDVALGETVGFTFGRAFRPRLDGYHYNYINLLLGVHKKIGGNIVMADYSRSFWYKTGTDTRRITVFTFRAYNNRLPFVTMALRTQYVSDKTDNPNGLILGGKTGLRGYDREFTSGNRVHVVNIEGRFFPGIEILSVKVGGAIFADFGRAWRKGQSVEFKDYYAAIGAGLRLSLERLSRGRMVRIDVTCGQHGRLGLSIGTGQYF